MNRLILSTILILIIPVVLLAQDWVEHIITDNLNGPMDIHVFDLNGDGAVDVLSANMNLPSYVSWWTNDGVGNFTMHAVDSSTSSANYYLTTCGTHLDENEFADILTAGRSSIYCWKNDGNENFSQYVVDNNFRNCFSLFATHVNNDEYMDVLGASYEDDDISWWENLDSSGTNWQEHPIDTLFDGARSVYAVDINGDNVTDVIGAAQDANSVCWWENMGGDPLTFTKHTIAANFSGANSVYAIDMDDDGDTDVLGAAYEDDDISWWENLDGSGTNWQEHPIDTLFDGATSVSATDVDQDGDMDVLGTAMSESVLAWWENDGSENFIKNIISSGTLISSPRSVSACDIDGDEDIDVLCTAFNADRIVWFENTVGDTNDVGPYSIDVPDIIPLDTTIYPLVTVTNYGNKEQSSFLVTCIINDPVIYSSTRTIQYLAPHTSIQFEFFSSFTFEETGSYTVIVYTRLAGDDEPANDTLAKVIAAIGINENEIDTPKILDFTAPTISKAKTNIMLALPEATKVDIAVYDILGRFLKTLVSERFSAGMHSIPLELDLTTGIYFYNLRTESGRHLTKKFLVIE